MIEVYHVLSCTISPNSNRNIFSLTNIASSLLVLHFENKNNANCYTYPKSYFVKNDVTISSFNPQRIILFVSKLHKKAGTKRHTLRISPLHVIEQQWGMKEDQSTSLLSLIYFSFEIFKNNYMPNYKAKRLVHIFQDWLSTKHEMAGNICRCKRASPRNTWQKVVFSNFSLRLCARVKSSLYSIVSPSNRFNPCFFLSIVAREIKKQGYVKNKQVDIITKSMCALWLVNQLGYCASKPMENSRVLRIITCL